MKTIAVTGGLGFIGSHYVCEALEFERVIVVDAVTYAGKFENLLPVGSQPSWLVFADFGTLPRRCAVKINRVGLLVQTHLSGQLERNLSHKWIPAGKSVSDEVALRRELECWKDSEERLFLLVADVAAAEIWPVLLDFVDAVVHFAAETHVDRSILSSEQFIFSDLHGTHTILEAIRRLDWQGRFLHVSTDEVYGEAGNEPFNEDDAIRPRNPYSVAKAAADRMVAAYVETYGVNAVIVRPSNNFGPRQHPEKLIPLMTVRAMLGLRLPVYGDGLQQREWLFVRDCVAGIRAALEHGSSGEVYNLGSGILKRNLEVVEAVLQLLDRPTSLIEYVADRPGHDRKYWLDSSKAARKLNWKAATSFIQALEQTVYWYKCNTWWWRGLLDSDPETAKFMNDWYEKR
ncbi:MAG: GDP-mannose 4,6-dehydratase [Acidobacteriota bacterium]|nr:GDP-mannose 4,6-dehydratase [Blastocatellia bacterium]MDW8411260.1 GDP-mannose 4,6-dehydratase [Acidobacteriota bacterium]